MIVSKTVLSVAVLIGVVAGTALAVNIETVPVGNPGNLGELSGTGAGGYGEDRICGSVAYTYNIGKYEVTAGQYTAFLNAVAGVDRYGLYNTTMSRTDYGSGITRSGGGTVGNPYTYTVASSHVNRPVNYVSYWDACRFANWLHNGQGNGDTETGAYTLNGYNGNDGRTIQRNAGWKWAVTSEDEWYKAAYYNPAASNYYDYPTSSNTVPGRDMNDVSGNNANYYGSPYPIQSPYRTTVAGEFQNSASPYGTFDQGGNVDEWNEAVVYFYGTYPYRGERGGSFYSSGGSDALHASRRGNTYPTYEYDSSGFRVSEVPEPGSAGIMLLGIVGLLRRRCPW